MLTFHWPFAILLLPLPWVIKRIWRDNTTIIQGPTIRFPRIERLQQATAVDANYYGSIKLLHILWHILWLLLVVTLMRPEAIRQPETVTQYGYDIMLAVDLSRSMAALDFTKNGVRTTRLNAVQDVVDKFVQQRKGDRIGLIVFAESAYPYVPLTFDIDSVSQQLRQLNVGMAGDSTAIGDAIGLAVKSLRHRQGEHILILLTDGQDNTSLIPPLQAAKLAAKHKIKIYTIGVGTNGLVPIRDNEGNLAMIEGALDEKLLADIANTTGGIYARATNKTSLTQIYQQINKLEQHKGLANIVMIRTTLHYFPLGCALLILLGFLGIYRRYPYALQ